MTLTHFQSVIVCMFHPHPSQPIFFPCTGSRCSSGQVNNILRYTVCMNSSYWQLLKPDILFELQYGTNSNDRSWKHLKVPPDPTVQLLCVLVLWLKLQNVTDQILIHSPFISDS